MFLQYVHTIYYIWGVSNKNQSHVKTMNQINYFLKAEKTLFFQSRPAKKYFKTTIKTFKETKTSTIFFQ